MCRYTAQNDLECSEAEKMTMPFSICNKEEQRVTEWLKFTQIYMHNMGTMHYLDRVCTCVYAVVAQTLSCCQKTHVSAISWEVNADIVLGLSRSCSRKLSGMRNHSNKCEVLQHVTKWTEVSHSHKKWVKAISNLSLVTDLVEENYWVMCEPPT